MSPTIARRDAGTQSNTTCTNPCLKLLSDWSIIPWESESKRPIKQSHSISFPGSLFFPSHGAERNRDPRNEVEAQETRKSHPRNMSWSPWRWDTMISIFDVHIVCTPHANCFRQCTDRVSSRPQVAQTRSLQGHFAPIGFVTRRSTLAMAAMLS